jgi:signal transduction histidine kinase
MSADIARARDQFRARNMAAVVDARKRIEAFRSQAMSTFEKTKKEREKVILEVAQTLNYTVRDVQMRHELVRRRLRQESVRRDVHVRVSRSLGALSDFLNMQREESIDEQKLLAAIADPAISGSSADKRRKASVSDLIISAQKHLIQQSEFINVAAHELRTPIMPILAYAEILESSMNGKSVELEAIKRNALRLQRLAENILNVARIDSKTLNLRREVFDLNLFAEEIISERRATTMVDLVFEPSAEELIVSADRERIAQVMSNLLDNAIKFTTKGQVIVMVRRGEGEVVVGVCDQGTGIDPDMFQVLFTKFGARSQGGTGLGLFISKGIVEAHGGKISAKNNGEYGSGGALFEFTLPLDSKFTTAANDPDPVDVQPPDVVEARVALQRAEENS